MVEASSIESGGSMTHTPNPAGPSPHPESSIARLDYYATATRIGFSPRISLKSYLSVIGISESMKPYLSRFKRWIQCMEENRDSTLLVEVAFKLSDVNSALILAILRYSADVPSGKRYTILTNTGCVAQYAPRVSPLSVSLIPFSRKHDKRRATT
jgi:hypothetical protein